MDTARCLGCGASVSAKPGACRHCGYTRGTTATQRVAAVCVAIATISALMVYVGWFHIPHVVAYL
jgi:hypothetical protein